MQIRAEFHEASKTTTEDNSQASSQSNSNGEEKNMLNGEPTSQHVPHQSHSPLEDAGQGSVSSDVNASSSKPKTHQIRVFFVSNRRIRFWYTAQEWSARLRLETCDLSHLMKEGFHWDKASIEPESGYFLLEKGELSADEIQFGWKCARVYHCLKMRDSVMQWKGELRILALKVETLAQFNLEQLTPDAVHGMVVRDAEDRLVYKHFRWAPQDSCNAYYDNMPMQGYWPWPKKSG